MNSPSDQPLRPTPQRRRRLPLFGLAIAPIPLIFLLSTNSDQPSGRLNLAAIPTAIEHALAETPAPPPAALPIQQRMLGVWEDDYQGHRTLSLNGDGTGRMVVELSGAAASLFADRLAFNQQWAFDPDQQLVTMTAIDGEPATKVNLVLRIYGREATYKVETVTDKQLILVDQADQKLYEWRRVEDSAASTEDSTGGQS
jgi:hypothetical protein